MEKLPERIVYIDDDVELRSLIRDVVEEQEFPGAFAICGSGDEFFMRVRVLQPQLVLLDLHMPDMDGPDVLEMMQKNPETEGLPVILLTGVTDLSMVKVYEKLGVMGVIHKPINTETFLQDIEDIWLQYASDDGDDGEDGENAIEE